MVPRALYTGSGCKLGVLELSMQEISWKKGLELTWSYGTLCGRIPGKAEAGMGWRSRGSLPVCPCESSGTEVGVNLGCFVFFVSVLPWQDDWSFS